MNKKLVECELGHKEHKSLLVDVNLQGESVVWDYPAIPDRLAKSFKMWVYDQPQYKYVRGLFCPGTDDVCLSLMLNKIWEGFETFLVMDLLSKRKNSNALVLDFGCQLGYFSLIAASFGCTVWAYDAFKESVDKLLLSKVENNLSGYITTNIIWVDENTKCIDISPFKEVELIKIDIEGAEQHAIRMCYEYIERKVVNCILMEVSPCFNDSYPELTARIMGCGYDAFLVPGKSGPETKKRFENDCWGTLEREFKITDVAKSFDGMYQENIMFRRIDG